MVIKIKKLFSWKLFFVLMLLNVNIMAVEESRWNQIENVISNGNFEHGKVKPNDWKITTARKNEKFSSSWDDKNVVSGKRSLYLNIDDFGNRSIQWSSAEFNVTAGAILSGEIHIKTEIKGSSEKQSDGCNVLIHFFDKTGGYLRNRQLVFSAVTHDWKRFKFKIQVPKKAVKALLVMGALRTKGEFWFDDLRLSERVNNSNPLSDLISSSNGISDIEPIIIPQPYFEKYDKSAFSLKFDKVAIYAKNPNSRAVLELKKIVVELGITDIVMSSKKEIEDRALFIFTSPNKNTLKTLASCNLSSEHLKKQSYLLEIELKKGLPQFTITGEEAGSYYAVQTLRQYLLNSDRDKKIATGIIFDKPAFKNRALISGSHSIRRLDLMAQRKMNLIFVVGSPHSSGWFKGLSDSDKKHHENFLTQCNNRFITPVPSIHPGYYRKESDGKEVGRLLTFTDDSLFEGMMEHFKDLYDLGYRIFDIAWDDMGRHGGQDKFLCDNDRQNFKSIAQAQRLYTAKVYKRLMEIDKNITLWTVGMSYWLDGSDFDTKYLMEFGKLPKEIKFISCGTMDGKSMAHHKSLTGREAIVWDNSAGTLNTEFVEPLNINVAGNVESLTDTYMFPIQNKRMVWDLISDYLWRGKELDPKSSARRSISVMIGAKYAKIIQETSETVNQLKNAPVSGVTSKEKLLAIGSKLEELKVFKSDLQKKVTNKIAKPFIKEIEELKRQLEIYRLEFTKRQLPLEVGYMKNPPSIDGIIGNDWKRATKLSDFRLIMKNRKKTETAANQTEAYIGWDEKALYLAFKCWEPKMSKIKSFVKKRDELVYHDDCIEIFLDPTRKAASYYHIAVNSLGTIFDYFVNKEPWNGDINVKTKVEDDFWVVEMSISFDSLNQKVKSGDIWNFNFCRERYAGKPEFSSWALLMQRFHEPQHFWTLKFIETSLK